MRFAICLCVLLLISVAPALGQDCPLQAAANQAAANSSNFQSSFNFANPNRIVPVQPITGFMSGLKLESIAAKVDAADIALAIVSAPEKMRASDLGKLRMMATHKALRRLIRVQLKNDEASPVVNEYLTKEKEELVETGLTILSAEGHLLAKVDLEMGLREIDEKIAIAGALAIWYTKMDRKLDAAEKAIVRQQFSSAKTAIDGVEKEDIQLSQRLAKLEATAEARYARGRPAKANTKTATKMTTKNVADDEASVPSFLDAEKSGATDKQRRFFAERIELCRKKLSGRVAVAR